MWHNKYIGLPYKHNGREHSGIDCWGLARLVYQEQFGIQLPSLVADYEGDSGKNIRELVNIQKESWQLVTTPEVPDLCVFNILGQPTHIGVYIGNRNFLHINDGHTSIVESLDSPKWTKRLEGIYRYSQQQIQLTGAPHPLQAQIVTDWVAAGKNLEELSVYIKQKYQISDRLFERIILVVDGVPVDKIYWHTRVLLPGETIAYRVLAGKNAVRAIATIAVIVAISIYAPQAGAALVKATGATGAAATALYTVGYIAAAAGISYVGGKLINAIAPVRMPNGPNDPGTPGTLNLFNGTSNQMNRFGAIPVVLGKVRMTGVLGAQPYIHSLENSNNISVVLIWGFGPLLVEDLQIGTIPLSSFYNDLTTGTLSQLAPATLYGYATEDQESFNNLYGQEIQQVYASSGGPVELVNNDTLGNPYTEISLTDEVTSMALSFTFPQGCRAINVKNGEISTAQTDIEIQYRPAYDADGNKNTSNTTWATQGGYATAVSANLLNNQTKSWVLPVPAPVDFPETTTNPDYPLLYQWHTISIGQGGRLTISSGTPTNDPASTEPPRNLKSYFYQKNFESLGLVAQPWSSTAVYDNNDLVKYDGYTYASLQANNINRPPAGDNYNVYWAYPDPSGYYLYAVKPQIPQGDIKLYEFCLKTGVGLFGSVVDLRGSNYTGFNLTITNNSNNQLDWVQTSAESVTVTMDGGKLTGSGYSTGIQNLIFNGTSFSNVAAYSSSINTISTWSPLLINNGIWSTTGNNVADFNATINFPVTAYYTIEMAVVGSASLYIAGDDYNSPGNTGFAEKITSNVLSSFIAGTAKLPLDIETITPVLSIDNNFFGTKFTTSLNVTKGNRKIRLISRGDASFSVGGNSYVGRVALRITYIAGGDLNPNPQTTNKLSIGIAGTYEKRKDPFNYTYSFYNLPKAQYDVRVRRANSDKDEEGDLRFFYSVQVNSLTGFSNNGPTNNPPGCYLAKSAIRLESTGKVNGTVDGVNALVTTRTYDWNGTGWKTNDPTNTLSNGTNWIPDRPTNNPASLFIYVLTHCANAYAIPVSKVPLQIDLLKLQEWHTFCFVKKLAFNNVLTNTQSVMDTLRDICAAGLASPAMVNGKWTVVIDRPRQYVTQYFTPHNSWGFESTKTLPRLPDALRITIQDESKAYQPDEFFVYREGFTESTAKIYEQISFPGVTNKAQAIYLAKFHLAQAKLRPETYSLNVDFEHLVCTRGDLVRVSHDIPQWGIGTGRITKIENPTANTTKLTLSEEFYIEPNKTYLIRIRTVQGAVVKTFSTPVTISAPQYINQITINEQLLLLSTPPEVDNLYMLGITTATTTAVLPVSEYEYTVPGTYTLAPITGSPFIKVTLVGGGGGGGGNNGSFDTRSGGGGGGSGGYSSITLNTSDIVGSFYITVGAGGKPANVIINDIVYPDIPSIPRTGTKNGETGGASSLTYNLTNYYNALGGVGGVGNTRDNNDAVGGAGGVGTTTNGNPGLTPDPNFNPERNSWPASAGGASVFGGYGAGGAGDNSNFINNQTVNFPKAGGSGYVKVQFFNNLPTTSTTTTLTSTLIPTTYTDSQELIVLSVEPQSNNTARLTLTDYSPTLYDDDFSNDVFLPNITGANTDVLIQRIVQTPNIINTDSDPVYAVQISPGVYQNTLVVAIGHPNGLPALATKIQLAYVEADAEFNDNTLSGLLIVDKSQSSFSIPGLISTKGYKIKVRYSNATGSITGPWSYPPITVSITGKSGVGSNRIEPPLIDVYLDDHYIYINPLSFQLLDNSDFKTFEYRVYRNPGGGDFWELGTGLTDIKSVQTRGPGRINIMEFDLGSGINPKPRLSFAGVQYRVACRTVDTNNNYSLTSSLGVVTVTHIK